MAFLGSKQHWIPKEILLLILNNLNASDLSKVSRLNSEFQWFVKDIYDKRAEERKCMLCGGETRFAYADFDYQDDCVTVFDMCIFESGGNWESYEDYEQSLSYCEDCESCSLECPKCHQYCCLDQLLKCEGNEIFNLGEITEWAEEGSDEKLCTLKPRVSSIRCASYRMGDITGPNGGIRHTWVCKSDKGCNWHGAFTDK